ncbi:winged helix-turn-helix domain-containing protein [Micromonospora polyrhachis]|uniref:DNA-binding transcriptional ArsR family regulator n=1 Tax=Micromonospora polyrhachis TaxID=1282883 RepID=A0A7W7WPM6_9ACTN|nr:winged helix-turn-helix domain-containing protein [Micromonospora polyrhachis]MBB4959401.1 DNA-binding transcriptional ArsR family regulator [Micromonospora polyrhachis]
MTATDPRLRAMAHPVRLRMLSLMWSAPLSAAELARELDISHALASQHLRKLDTAGFVELVEVRAHRGGRERRYRTVRGTPLSDEQVGTPLVAESLAHNLRERAARRTRATAGVTTDAELWVAPEVWDDVRQRLAALMADLHDAAQVPHAPGTVRVGTTLMAFLLDEPTPAQSSRA